MTGAGTSQQPDELQADAKLIRLCEQHIANVRAYEAGPDRHLDDPDPLGIALDGTRAAILRTRARTIAGIKAKARLAVQQAEIDLCGDDWGHSDAGTWAQEVVRDLVALASVRMDCGSSAPG